jgi:hypothetical protein
MTAPKPEWMTATNKSYDFAYTRDHTGTKARLHQVTFAVDAREYVLRAADIFLENGIFIETGPHKHAIQQTFFLYVYEPGGNRVEVSCAGARIVLAPDWKPIRWTEADRRKGQACGLQTSNRSTPRARRRSLVFLTHDREPAMTRRNTPRVSFIGFGEAGQAIASGLRDAGIERIAAWDILFPGTAGVPLKAAAQTMGVRMALSAADAVRETDMIISAVTAASSADAARSAAPHLIGKPYFLDINSVWPGRKQGDSQSAGRRRPLCRRGCNSADSPCPAPYAAVDRRAACGRGFAAAP